MAIKKGDFLWFHNGFSWVKNGESWDDHGTRPGKQFKLLKPWHIEIVDLPSYRMGGFSIVMWLFTRG